MVEGFKFSSSKTEGFFGPVGVRVCRVAEKSFFFLDSLLALFGGVFFLSCQKSSD